jgi:rod shape-determining protein MreC
MLRLFTFLSEYRNVLLFLVLETVAMLFIVRYNDRQRHAFGDSVLETAAKVQQKRNEFDHYFMLDEENAALMQENIRLRRQVEDLKKRVNVYSGLQMRDSIAWAKADTLLSQEVFNYMPCRAIRNTTEKNYNYITIDKGSRHGVANGMGLVSPQGIAGMVIRTGQNYSLALSVLNISFKLSAKVKRNDNVGSFEWTGADTRHGYLRYIPLNVELRVGDEVVTSGYSTVFPEGFPIGKISKITPDTQTGAYEAEVQLATNFNALTNIYLVPAAHQPALDSLETGVNQ